MIRNNVIQCSDEEDDSASDDEDAGTSEDEIHKHQEEKMIVGEDEEYSSQVVKTKQVAMKRDAPSGS
ncbi:MAG: hypothetical protein M3264_00360 [Thermoproteota archaeon]|nr:hypothetical protein [Thermoproteota archaeon]